MTGSVSTQGVNITSTVASDVTTVARAYNTFLSTAAAAFTLGSLIHYRANQNAIGAGSTVTNQIGFNAESTLTGATNNYGFYGAIASGTNRWNTYMVGTAANYFAGQTTVGSTSLTLGASSVAQQFGVVSTAAANIVQVIRGAASQTGDLAQWQNSAGTVLASITGAGVLNAPFITNAQVASYTLVLADAGKLVEMSNASANNLTVPLNATVAYPVGAQINILQTGAGQTTVVATGGVTINATPGLKLRAQWSSATLIKRATDTWVLVGDISA
jgi:hypothetical protein